MSRTIKMKEVERTVNNFWRVKGRYYTAITEVIGYEGVVFSIYDTNTDEMILDLNVPYSECTYELTMKLHEEIINKCNINCTDADKTRFNYGVIQYNVVQAFICEWLEILEMISEYIKSSYCL
ncbi:hypothetical protein [Clostridium butyricum]|uniref:hypothetical protein n=1 Tax=Clostridium butyricum TaxID=1492 RepID=UPI0013D0C847|nr:hypothetical protein [Clostridium butyricum]MCQ2017858.1 hypothetical protein [Clostridium butyricum]MCQ2021684.1 hypothetical protein [Clostridium butyricum]NFB72175.1 hypothetical protein [Clostridium butyricum]NFB91997.1 hypothetical protein [Clostridium butyricum]UTY52879.1 hypothetical protein HNS01_07150 [Clostridium butyricum]